MSSIISTQKLKKYKDYDSHHKVIHIQDKRYGLNGFISIHNINLGSAVGGTRFFPYKNETEALIDSLRLSKAMTYKCAISDVPFGGGKAVLIGNSNGKNKDLVLKKYAQEVQRLKGLFYTGEDVGITEQNVQEMLKYSDYFIGKSKFAGDPSPFAALSVYECMKLVASKVLRSKSLKGLKIAVKGVGKVGSSLVEHLIKEKAKIYIADLNKAKTDEIKDRYKSISVVDSNKINKIKVDIYAPCAMGEEFNFKTMKDVRAKIICGAANNQLSNNKVDDWFYSQKIYYVPDYLVNSGGLINVVDEISPGGYQKNRVLKRIENVVNGLDAIIDFSLSQSIPMSRIANFIAERRFSV